MCSCALYSEGRRTVNILSDPTGSGQALLAVMVPTSRLWLLQIIRFAGGTSTGTYHSTHCKDSVACFRKRPEGSSRSAAHDHCSQAR